MRRTHHLLLLTAVAFAACKADPSKDDDVVETDVPIAEACDDLDDDGTCDDNDDDIDGDGCLNADDAAPRLRSDDADADGFADDCDACDGDDALGDFDDDGTCDDRDLDDDNDGCADDLDAAPFTFAADLDGDGVAEDCDLCEGDDATGDADADGVCNDLDSDADNDGCSNDVDDDPTVASADSDLDGFGDACDLCDGDDVLGDLDNDGTCDDLDVDDDGDGCDDNLDDAPNTPSPDVDGDGVSADCDLCQGDDATGDAEGDGLCNGEDLDDDNDGCLDPVDANPLVPSTDTDADGVNEDCDICLGDDSSGDTDGDGTCNNLDDDDDNDGCLDAEDIAPLVLSTDDDADGISEDCDLCQGLDFTNDPDGDGLCNNLDPDNDDDGCPDALDAFVNFPSVDTDGDGIAEDCDLCLGADAAGDADGDGICDNLDVDDDGDGCPDGIDADTSTATPDADGDGVGEDCDLCLGDDATGDIDSDGICGDLDDDDDGDGCLDSDDPAPDDFSPDADADSFGLDCDLCDGNDLTGDVDGDLLCNNLDPDNDGDGCDDLVDPFPNFFGDDLDGDGVSEHCDLCDGDDLSGDADVDGVCSNLDDDDDGDGCLDLDDASPMVSSPDTDGDGVAEDCDLCVGDDGVGDLDGDQLCDDLDFDDDNDGCNDPVDTNPRVPSVDGDGDGVAEDCDLCLGNDFSGDVDSDGICSDLDDDDDGDGCLDIEDPAINIFSVDLDGDGRGLDCDLCLGDDAIGDNDSDGVCNDLDNDDDNDGCGDTIDPAPFVASTDLDGDGVASDCDLCSGNDASGDTDGDDTCNNLDDDDDNDTCLDVVDTQPLSFSIDTDGDGIAADCDLCKGFDPSGDTDADGTCDDLDDDDDNDLCDDPIDAAPLVFAGDSDGDGAGDDCDLCQGLDTTGDTDSDGTCNDLDDDDDNDGCLDVQDAIPLFPSSDLDGDGVSEDCDLCLGDDATGDANSDGICEDLSDDDNDGCLNLDDPHPSGLGSDAFFEPFVLPLASSYTEVDDDPTDGTHVWSFQPTTLEGQGAGGTVASGATPAAASWAYADDSTFGQGQLRARIKRLDANATSGLVWAVQDSTTFLRAWFGPTEARLEQVDNGVVTMLDQGMGFPLPVGDWVSVRVSHNAGEVSVFLNEVQVLDGAVDPCLTGHVGLLHFGGSATRFDDLRISDQPFTCGNNTLDAGEACDDGNFVEGDGCTFDCQLEFCGDALLQAPEQCDDGGVPGPPCSSQCTHNAFEELDYLTPVISPNVVAPGQLRGSWFTAPIDMTIYGARVPTSIGTGDQHLEVVKLNVVPPAFPSTTSAFTSLASATGVAGTGWVPLNLSVSAGDRIGLLGGRESGASMTVGSVSGGTSTVTTLGSQPVTLYRLGTSNNVISSGLSTVWQETAAVGVVELQYVEIP